MSGNVRADQATRYRGVSSHFLLLISFDPQCYALCVYQFIPGLVNIDLEHPGLLGHTQLLL